MRNRGSITAILPLFRGERRGKRDFIRVINFRLGARNRAPMLLLATSCRHPAALRPRFPETSKGGQGGTLARCVCISDRYVRITRFLAGDSAERVYALRARIRRNPLDLATLAGRVESGEQFKGEENAESETPRCFQNIAPLSRLNACTRVLLDPFRDIQINRSISWCLEANRAEIAIRNRSLYITSYNLMRSFTR